MEKENIIIEMEVSNMKGIILMMKKNTKSDNSYNRNKKRRYK